MGAKFDIGKAVHASFLSKMSPWRIAGVAAGALWVLLLFYSVSLYSRASTIRGSLYLSLFIAMIAVAFTLAVLSLVRKRDAATSGVAVLSVAAAMTCVGSFLNSLSDAGTVDGMLLLGIGALLAGSGSAVLLLGWMDVLSGSDSRTALFEVSFGGCAAFVAGLVACNITWLACSLAIGLPALCAFLLHRSATLRDDSPEALPPEPASASTKGLFAKIAAGALLVGMLQGFFDLILGYRAYSVFDVYGVYLFVGGFFALLVLCAAVLLLAKDAVFAAYRLAMFLLCLGCLLAPFVGDGTTYYSGAVIFGGYACFGAALCSICIEASTSFRMSCVRIAALAFAALFLGEVAGFVVGFAVQDVFADMELARVTLIAVSILFVAHGFVLTELDLVRVGIGEVGAASAESAPSEQRAHEVDPCALIVSRFGLTPRESDVLPLLLQGRTISRIQEALFISAGTVSTHIRHIYQKTGVADRQGLIDLVESEVAVAACEGFAAAAPSEAAPSKRGDR